MSSIVADQTNTAASVIVDAHRDGDTWVAECGEMPGWTAVAPDWDELVRLASDAVDFFAEDLPKIRGRGAVVVHRLPSPFESGQRNS